MKETEKVQIWMDREMGGVGEGETTARMYSMKKI